MIPASSSIKVAHLYRDKDLRGSAHNMGIDRLEQQVTVKCLELQNVPLNTQLIFQTIMYRYVREKHVNISQRKVRCSLRSDLMKPGIYYGSQ